MLAAVLAVLGVWSRSTASGARAPDVGLAVAGPVGAGPTPVAPAPSSPGAPTPGGTTAPGGAVTLSPTVELAVVAAARDVLGTAGLDGAAAGARDRWPLHARVVEITPVTDRLGVATVHALVIERTRDGWGAPRTLAAAVPLSLDREVAVAGPAWPLPDPAPAAVELAGRPVTDPDPGVVQVLLDRGWAIDEVLAVDLLDGGVLRLRLRATAPGDHGATPHEVWLLDAPGGVRTLPLADEDSSTATSGSAAADPSPQPSTTDRAASGTRTAAEPTTEEAA